MRNVIIPQSAGQIPVLVNFYFVNAHDRTNLWRGHYGSVEEAWSAAEDARKFLKKAIRLNNGKCPTIVFEATHEIGLVDFNWKVQQLDFLFSLVNSESP